jgi:hypothetical protein
MSPVLATDRTRRWLRAGTETSARTRAPGSPGNSSASADESRRVDIQLSNDGGQSGRSNLVEEVHIRPARQAGDERLNIRSTPPVTLLVSLQV